MTDYEIYQAIKKYEKDHPTYPANVYAIESLTNKSHKKHLGYFETEENFNNTLKNNLEWANYTMEIVSITPYKSPFGERRNFLAKCFNCTLDEVNIKARSFFDKYPDIPYENLSEKDFNLFISEFKNKD